jgi:hypothetical protein
MRIFSYIIGIIFVLFALVQLNDPDFVIWVVAYMIPAIIAFMFPHKKQNRMFLVILALAYLIVAISLFPPSISNWISAEEESKSLGMKLPGIEEARESMGLFICFLAILFFWFKSKEATSR